MTDQSDNPNGDPGAVPEDEGSNTIENNGETDTPQTMIDPPRFGAWIFAIGLALLIAVGGPLLSSTISSAYDVGINLFGNLYLPITPLILLFLCAVVWNPLARFIGEGLRFRGSELLLIAAMTYLAAGVTDTGLASNWAKSLTSGESLLRNRKLVNLHLPKDDNGRPTMAEGEDGTIAAYPLGLTLTPGKLASKEGDEAGVMSLRGLVEGKQTLESFTTPLPTGKTGPGGEAIMESPASRIAGTLSNSFPLVLASLVMVMGMVAFTTRQWLHHERLQYPLLQVPEAMASPGLLKQPAFIWSFIAMMVYWCYQFGAQYGWHPLPMVNHAEFVKVPELNKVLGMESSPGGAWIYNDWSTIAIYPFAIGIAFLLALDIGFSVWAGYWSLIVLFGWMYAAGIPLEFSPHGRTAGNGATLAMAGVILYLGRHHYAQLLKAAVIPGTSGKTGDVAGVWGARMLIIGAAGIVALLMLWGCSFLGAVLGVLIALAMLIVVARVIAETGLASFESSEKFNTLVGFMGLPFIMPLKAVMVLSWIGQVPMGDTRENLAGMAPQAAGMADRNNIQFNRFIAVGTVLVVVVAVLAVGARVIGAWTNSLEGIVPGTPGFNSNKLFNTVDGGFRPAFGSGNTAWGPSMDQIMVIVGAAAVFAVMGIRRFWVAFPFHPIGLVVATSFPVYKVWASLAIGWFVKVMIMRYGGSHLYKVVKPAAIGLIMGDAIGFGLQLLIKVFGLFTGADVGESWRTWP